MSNASGNVQPRVKPKNYRKRGFRKGHAGYVTRMHSRAVQESESERESLATWMPRLTEVEFERVANVTSGGLIEIPDAEGRCGEAKLLRPKQRVSDDDELLSAYQKPDDSREEEMRLYEKGKMQQMYNDCIRLHSAEENKCAIPEFTICREVKVGLCWQCALRCRKCGFTSSLYKLYNEIETGKRGRKPATPNVGLQVGLQESTTGNVKGRVILTCLNLPVPNRSVMQRTANKVAAATATMTLEDLAMRRERVKHVNRLRGLPEDSPINIAMDSRYNSATITGAYHAGQNASQAIAVAVEKQSGHSDIVGISIQNKLCALGASMRRRGLDVTCPGHKNCTATLPADQPLSEYVAGIDIGRQFAKQNVGIRYVVTDGDARSAEGVKAGMAGTSCVVERQADTTHLEQSVFRNSMKAKFSPRMFPGSTAVIRKEQRKHISLDVKTRCHRIHRQMLDMHAGDSRKVSALMPRVIETTFNCYGGDCTQCRYSSVVCGRGKKTSWWHRSMHLQTAQIHYLNMTDQDRVTLRNVIRMRIGAMTKLCLNTNRNESLNRGLSATLPKNVKFSRTVTGRACAAIDRLNYGAGASMLRKLESNKAPISKGGRVASTTRQIQREALYHRAYMRRPSVRMRLASNKRKRFDAVRAARRRREATAETRAAARRETYQKGQLDRPVLKETQTNTAAVNKKTGSDQHYSNSDRSRRGDHTYPYHM